MSRPPDASADQRGSSRYEVVRQIGSGGMGEVYLARDSMLERNVALKFLPEDLEANATAQQRFLREAKSAAALDHPYICKIYEIGEIDGKPFIAMEYVDGQTLQQRLEAGAMPTNEALGLVIQIVEALETAHAAGIVHRDLKPANIMVTASGHAKVMDFGLAKRVDAPTARETAFETASRLTKSGTLLGTPAYMSPEHMRGEPIDTRSDTFALGVILYEMLTGVHPFARDAAMDTIAAILSEDPAPMARHDESLSGLPELVVEKMTAKAPDARYQSIGEVRIDLERIRQATRELGGRVGAGPAQAAPETTASTDDQAASNVAISRSAPAWLRTAIGTLVVGLAGLGFAWWVGVFGADATAVPGNDASTTPVPDRRQVVAVFPFLNLGGDPQDDSLVEGFSQSVANALVAVGARVRAWERVWLLYQENKDHVAVATALDADVAITGSVNFLQDVVLLSLTVTDVETGEVVRTWSDEWSDEDLLGMRRQLAEQAAVELDLELGNDDRELLATLGTADSNAMQYYYEGAYWLRTATTLEEVNNAINYFRLAVDADADYVDAHIGLAAAQTEQWWMAGGSVPGLLEARDSYRRALEIDPGLMTARRGLMIVNWTLGDTWPEAVLEAAHEAREYANPDDVEWLLVMAYGNQMGRYEPEGGKLFLNRALELDSENSGALLLSLIGEAWTESETIDIERAQLLADRLFALEGQAPEFFLWLGMAYHMAGDRRAAILRYEEGIRLASDPDLSRMAPWPENWIMAGAAHAQLGETARAEELWQSGLEVLDELLNESPENPRLHLLAAITQGLLGNKEAMLAHQERGLKDGYANLWTLTLLAGTYEWLGMREDAFIRPSMLNSHAPFQVIAGFDPRQVPELNRVFEQAREQRRQLVRTKYPMPYWDDPEGGR